MTNYAVEEGEQLRIAETVLVQLLLLMELRWC